MPLRLRPNGVPQVGDGPSPWGQEGRQHPDQKPVIRGRGQSRPQYREYWHRPSWHVHRFGPSMGGAAASLPGVWAAISP
jgi:hypothetical protein